MSTTDASTVFEEFTETGDIDRAEAVTLTVAQGLFEVAAALRSLGTGNASTDVGAIENLAMEVRDLGSSLSTAISEGLTAIADAQTA